MDLKINPEFQRFIEDQVKAGHYDSPDAIVNAALATFQSGHELSSEEIDYLRSEVDKGIEEADRGDFVEFTAEDIIARCRAELEQKRTGS